MRLKTIAYLRRVVHGDERFLYSAQLRPSDYVAAVTRRALEDWCAYAECARSNLALALQDTSIRAVLRRTHELERGQPEAWFTADDVRRCLTQDTDESHELQVDVVESLSAILAVLCALYAKLLACVDPAFLERLRNDTTPVQISTVYGPMTMQTLLEPFPEAAMLTDADVDTLLALHHILSVCRLPHSPRRTSCTNSPRTSRTSRGTRPSRKSTNGTRYSRAAILTGTSS